MKFLLILRKRRWKYFCKPSSVQIFVARTRLSRLLQLCSTGNSWTDVTDSKFLLTIITRQRLAPFSSGSRSKHDYHECIELTEYGVHWHVIVRINNTGSFRTPVISIRLPPSPLQIQLFIIHPSYYV